MFKAAGEVWYEIPIAFHFMRYNVYSPFICIGIYAAMVKNCTSRYLPQYGYIQKQFYDEWKSAKKQGIRPSADFLEAWRSNFQEPCNVISKIINYCCVACREDVFIHDLYFNYVNNPHPLIVGRIVSMLKRRERFFSLEMRNNFNFDRKLIEEGYDVG